MWIRNRTSVRAHGVSSCRCSEDPYFFKKNYNRKFEYPWSKSWVRYAWISCWNITCMNTPLCMALQGTQGWSFTACRLDLGAVGILERERACIVKERRRWTQKGVVRDGPQQSFSLDHHAFYFSYHLTGSRAHAFPLDILFAYPHSGPISQTM